MLQSFFGVGAVSITHICSVHTHAFLPGMCAALQKLGNNEPVLPDRTLEATRPYASAVVSLGNRLVVPVVDLYSSLQSVPSWQSSLLKDGLHFTAEGSRAVWREVHRILEKELPQLRWVGQAACRLVWPRSYESCKH